MQPEKDAPPKFIGTAGVALELAASIRRDSGAGSCGRGCSKVKSLSDRASLCSIGFTKSFSHVQAGLHTVHGPLPRATGRAARSCTRFSDQNVCVTSRSMWECLYPAQGGGQDRSVHGTSGEAARAASGPAPTPRAGLPFPNAKRIFGLIPSREGGVRNDCWCFYLSRYKEHEKGGWFVMLIQTSSATRVSNL